jgi:hypothetical protein
MAPGVTVTLCELTPWLGYLIKSWEGKGWTYMSGRFKHIKINIMLCG